MSASVADWRGVPAQKNEMVRGRSSSGILSVLLSCASAVASQGLPTIACLAKLDALTAERLATGAYRDPAALIASSREVSFRGMVLRGFFGSSWLATTTVDRRVSISQLVKAVMTPALLPAWRISGSVAQLTHAYK